MTQALVFVFIALVFLLLREWEREFNALLAARAAGKDYQ